MNNQVKVEPQKREKWGSKLGFILAASSWSIGLGNIWRFPYITGLYGGGAFVLVYLICLFVIAIPLLAVEYSLGRESQSSPTTGFQKLAPNKPWVIGGWFGMLGGIMIFSYYVMIIGWVLSYTGSAISGGFVGMNVNQIKAGFDILTANTGLVIFLELIILITLGIIVSKGLVKGVEAFSKIAMPVILLLFIGLFIYSVTLPGAFVGLEFYLKPDFSKIGFEAILVAIGQVFLSIGVGQGASWVYGSYLSKESDIPGNAVKVGLFDSGFALLAGLIIFPACFASGVNPDSGFSLIFATLPNVFNVMPGGRLFGGIFFIGVLFAAITSAIAFTECISSWLMDTFKMDRNKDRVKAVWLTLLGTFILSLPSILSFGALSHIKIFGMDMFGFIDYVSANIMLVGAGLVMSLYAAWSLGIKKFAEITNAGSSRFKVENYWEPLLKYIIPFIIAIMFIYTVFA